MTKYKVLSTKRPGQKAAESLANGQALLADDPGGYPARFLLGFGIVQIISSLLHKLCLRLKDKVNDFHIRHPLVKHGFS